MLPNGGSTSVWTVSNPDDAEVVPPFLKPAR